MSIDLRIEELVLRVPGVSAEEGRAVAQRVGERVALALSWVTPRTWPTRLELVVRSAPNAGPDELVDSIATALLRALGADA